MPTKQILFALLTLILLIYSCHKDENKIRTLKDTDGKIVSVQLSLEESERAGIQFAGIEMRTATRYIPCSGYLVVAPESILGIPAPAEGKIKSILYQAGQSVNPGSLMAILENSDFILLQQEYLDAVNQFEYFKEEYTRQGELTVENATSLKKMQIARREYHSAELKLHALKLQLEILGIRPDSVAVGKITPEVLIYSPRKGIISTVMIHTGSFVEKGEMLFELIKSKPLQAKLAIPEKYALFIKKEQPVELHMINDSATIYWAKLVSVGHEIDLETKTATVFAELKETNPGFIPGMSVNARIKTLVDSVCYVNSNSILHGTTHDYVFAKKNGNFKRIQVTKGIVADTLTEIIDFPSEISDSVVVSGTVYLNSLFESQ